MPRIRTTTTDDVARTPHGLSTFRPHSWPHPADGGQLEDEPDPSRGGRAGPEARLDPGGQEARLLAYRGWGAPAGPRPPLRADPRGRRPARHTVRRAGRLGARLGC